MLSSLQLPPLSSSSPSITTSLHLSPNQPLYLKFHTSYRENLRYLKALGIITKSPINPLPADTLTHILSTVSFLKSKGISDHDFRRLAFLAPQLFSSHFDPADIEPVFEFLTSELQASVNESRGLVFNCPNILFSDVEYCLRPTLDYLKKLGLVNLNVPSTSNAHLLNTRVDKLRSKIAFLKSIGLNYKEAAKFSARMPAIFGYNIDDNLRPKYEFLVFEMARSLNELKDFPQFFGFSLERKIAPRHWHLKQRNVNLKLNRMLLWSDERFYSKWK